ncbi:unnamed protein product [Peronospora belbahrii]|uniref:Uncharacterized protein n=1 Tax=Peronospora belbahrii TaxID=622444 RepID=A0ABN8DA17_9STRA|nr:unnamed protein product [Peronospora belbahrii]
MTLESVDTFATREHVHGRDWTIESCVLMLRRCKFASVCHSRLSPPLLPAFQNGVGLVLSAFLVCCILYDGACLLLLFMGD